MAAPGRRGTWVADRPELPQPRRCGRAPQRACRRQLRTACTVKRLAIGIGVTLLLLPALVLASVAAPPATPAIARGVGDNAQVLAAPPQMRAFFLAAAHRFALPPALLVAIAKVESGFTPTAVGPVTPYGQALGMMQFLPSSWPLFNVVPGATPFDPAPAVLAAANHLLTSGRLARGGWDAAQAVFGYNHSDDYVATVLGWANQFGYHYDPTAPPLDRRRYRYPVDGPARRIARHGEVTFVVRRPASALACVLAAVVDVDRRRGSVTLRGEDGWLYHYAGLSHIAHWVVVGGVVPAGARIGSVAWPGRSGRLTFVISRGDEVDGVLDPVPYLDVWRRHG